MWKSSKKASDCNSREEAYNYALFLLSLRFMGIAELRRKLQDKGFVNEVIVVALEKLSGMGYLDDNRLLEAIIGQYRERDVYGATYIKQKLRQRGFGDEQIKGVMEGGFTKDHEMASAKRFLAKEKIHKFIDSTNEVDQESARKSKQRLMAKMQRRGFSLEIVYKIFKNEDPD